MCRPSVPGLCQPSGPKFAPCNSYHHRRRRRRRRMCRPFRTRHKKSLRRTKKTLATQSKHAVEKIKIFNHERHESTRKKYRRGAFFFVSFRAFRGWNAPTLQRLFAESARSALRRIFLWFRPAAALGRFVPFVVVDSLHPPCPEGDVSVLFERT